MSALVVMLYLASLILSRVALCSGGSSVQRFSPVLVSIQPLYLVDGNCEAWRTNNEIINLVLPSPS